MISQKVEVILHKCFVYAREHRHEFITVEHLLYGLLNSDEGENLAAACGANVDQIKNDTSVFISENVPIVEGGSEIDSQPTLGFQRVIQRAIMNSQSENDREVVVADLMVALFGEADSHAVYFLKEGGLHRNDLINFIKKGIKKENNKKIENEKYRYDIREENLKRKLDDLALEIAASIGKSNVKVNKKHSLFISYSHADTAALDRLLVHLKPLERSNTIICWSDKRLRVGDKWKDEIESNLSSSVIAILLISADFLASDFIINNELPPLLAKADSQGLKILPVVLKPCGFRRDPVLSSFQSANDPSKPLLGMSSIEQEAIYDLIAEEVFKEISRKRQMEEAST